MRFIFTLILLIAAVIGAQLYFPWWSMAIACFAIGWIMGMNGVSSFFTGFLALFLVWGGYSFYLSEGNPLCAKIAGLFGLSEKFGDMGSIALIVATALIGALVGGLSTMTGSLGRNIFRRKKVEEVA